MAIHPETPAVPRRHRTRDLVAVNIGNALEWFDWNIYSIFAAYFAAQFFATGDPISDLLSTLAVFAVGFVMRPIGGWLFGVIADRKGRKFSLTLAILLAATGSLLIAVAPTTELVGWFAGVILLIARLLQGLAHGGETGSAFTYLAEIAPRERRALWASTPWLGVGIGTMGATALGVLMTSVFSPEQMEAFGWRIPFAVGALIGLYAIWIRRRMAESEVHTASRKNEGGGRDRRLRDVFREMRENSRALLTIVGLTISGVVAFYTWFIFAPGYAVREFGMDDTSSLVAGLLGQAVFLVAVPLMGALADRWGRRPVLLIFSVGFAVLAFPLELLLSDNPFTLWLAMAAATVLMAANCAPLGAIFAELVPTRVRATIIGIGYATAGAVLGGTAPYLNTWLSSLHLHGAFVVYMIVLCAISTVVAIVMRETKGKDLTADD
ncbi:MAG: MFS transporter [Microbacterium sp.]